MAPWVNALTTELHLAPLTVKRDYLPSVNSGHPSQTWWLGSLGAGPIHPGSTPSLPGTYSSTLWIDNTQIRICLILNITSPPPPKNLLIKSVNRKHTNQNLSYLKYNIPPPRRHRNLLIKSVNRQQTNQHLSYLKHNIPPPPHHCREPTHQICK